jgi:hypothetical protein
MSKFLADIPMAFSRMVDKPHIMCRCEGWMLFLARSNPLCGWEIDSSGLDTCTCSRCKCTAKEHAYSTLLTTTLHS